MSDFVRLGVAVKCSVCGRAKKPIGRDSRDNGLCDYECEGYMLDPLPDNLWPGEKTEQLQ
jgi:hypothetical protein